MPEEEVWALTDLATPWSVMVVVTLGVPELVARGPRDLDELSRTAGADPQALLRVLRHLAQRGLFRETEGPRIELTERGRMLLGRNPGLDLDGIGGRVAEAWSTLLQTVRTGRAAYADRFGRPFWDDLTANPNLAASFDAWMGPDGSDMPDPEILPDGDWGGVRTVLDVGGGIGAQLVAILRAHPELRGGLVDLPGTAERARAFLAAHGVADRVSFAPQSFFDPLPRGGDLYLLRRVLNDWPDDDKQRILSRCAEAMGRDARLIVLGGVVADEEEQMWPDLVMLLLVGAGDTPLSRFRELSSRAGLRIRRVYNSSARDGHHDLAIECVLA